MTGLQRTQRKYGAVKTGLRQKIENKKLSENILIYWSTTESIKTK